MYRLKLFSAVGLLWGCGAPIIGDFQTEFNECSVTEFKKIGVQGKRDCECITENIILEGRKFVEDAGILPPGLDFSDLTILISDSDSLDDDLGNDKNGSLRGRYFAEIKTIVTSRRGEGIAHELMHHYEINFLGVSLEDSAAHKNWEENQYKIVTYRFLTKYEKLDACPLLLSN